MTERISDEWTLNAPPGFSFDHTFAYLARSTNECLFLTDSDSVTRCIPAAGAKPIVNIRASENGGLRINVRGVAPSRLDDARKEIAAYVGDWLDLRTDLSPFLELASRDPLLQTAVRRFAGLRLVGVPDLFEAVAWAILGQQINLPFAYTLKRRLVEAYGDAVSDGTGAVYRLFPSAETIADLRADDLASLKMTMRKAETLLDAARMIARGDWTKERLAACRDAAEAERELASVRGIGPWTAHYVSMRCLRFRDAFPIGDVGLHLAIQRLLDMERKPTIPEIRRLASSWYGWEAYAVFYLWRTLY
ncbi:DNA-3-methyladenine glycosylase 2 [Cohnella caldifontis]|uniref:DNA-3-methyladenine glycosylase 2 n=1 Tax=Cohnella caldifontis TaxID=3027471 RepID=UPI0023EC60CD|nr:DNA-3-methyladenine glycosylase [Cohnella sp. YIM B05605]